jgi:outer membrane protein OmpA-like peptidoglycan-associated protein
MRYRGFMTGLRLLRVFVLMLVFVGDVPAPGSLAWARSIILPTFYFGPGRADISVVSSPLADVCAAIFRAKPEIELAEIRGHTDGREQEALGLARAETVVAALVARGVDPGRIVARGYGSTKRGCKKSNEACRETNRRVDIVILKWQPRDPS